MLHRYLGERGEVAFPASSESPGTDHPGQQITNKWVRMNILQSFKEDVGVLASKTPFIKSAASKTVPVEDQKIGALLVGCHDEVLH